MTGSKEMNCQVSISKSDIHRPHSSPFKTRWQYENTSPPVFETEIDELRERLKIRLPYAYLSSYQLTFSGAQNGHYLQIIINNNLPRLWQYFSFDIKNDSTHYLRLDFRLVPSDL
jgi:hypothetical protein